MRDLLATFVAEAAIHHLDMMVELTDVEPPPGSALALVRATPDGLVGGPLAVEWSDEEYALKGPDACR